MVLLGLVNRLLREAAIVRALFAIPENRFLNGRASSLHRRAVRAP